ncbi:unnamed protein product [Dovyalis caffra]|uniref:Uncharacterized protein n=1 Tax=Dovyalis caffra TaxID=77055 RepID=A0AAV1RHR8_9ROSI|nr:unnamed protein product [Dovyalis caffra]
MVVRNIDAGRNVREAILKEIPNAQIEGFRHLLPSFLKITFELLFATNHKGDNFQFYQLLFFHGQSKLVNLLHPNELARRLEGATTTCYVALHPQVKGISGKYFMDNNMAEPSSQAEDAELAKKLWDFTLCITEKSSQYSFKICGFIIGTVSPIRKLMICDSAPLRMIDSSASLLGIPKFSAGGSAILKGNGEPWKLYSNETFSPPKRDSSSPRIAKENSGPSANINEGSSPPSASSSASSTVSLNHVSSEKNRNGFAKFFSRGKNGIQLEI